MVVIGGYFFRKSDKTAKKEGEKTSPKTFFAAEKQFFGAKWIKVDGSIGYFHQAEIDEVAACQKVSCAVQKNFAFCMQG